MNCFTQLDAHLIFLGCIQKFLEPNQRVPCVHQKSYIPCFNTNHVLHGQHQSMSIMCHLLSESNNPVPFSPCVNQELSIPFLHARSNATLFESTLYQIKENCMSPTQHISTTSLSQPLLLEPLVKCVFTPSFACAMCHPSNGQLCF